MIEFVPENSQDAVTPLEGSTYRPANLGVIIQVGLVGGNEQQFSINLLHTVKQQGQFSPAAVDSHSRESIANAPLLLGASGISVSLAARQGEQDEVIDWNAFAQLIVKRVSTAGAMTPKFPIEFSRIPISTHAKISLHNLRASPYVYSRVMRPDVHAVKRFVCKNLCLSTYVRD